MDTLFNDLRYSVRQLAKSPAFTLVAVMTLALGIGANTAIFSAVNTVLLKPLPYAESNQLVVIQSTGFQDVKFGVSYPDLHDLRGLTQDFSGVSASSTQRYNLTGAGDPQEVQAAMITPDAFDVLRVRPEIGRVFTAAEERAPLALLSHSLWVTNFGGDPHILGKGISLDGASYTVIGVMPGGFHFPTDNVQVWTPIGGLLTQNPQAETDRGFHFLNAVARVIPGVSDAKIRGDLHVLATRLNASDSSSDVASGPGPRRMIAVAGPGGPGGPPGAGPKNGASSILDNGFDVSYLRDQGVGNVRGPLLILLGAVGLVLLIACANAANLLLARAAGRRREMAIRQALGAARSRLIRQLLTESVLLALAAGLVGVILSTWGLDALLAMWPRALPRTGEIGLDGRVLLFTLGLAVTTGLAFGLIPAWRASATGIEGALRDDAAGSTGGHRRRLQGSLVIGEMAVALVLLVGAGLLIKSFIHLSSINPGFDTQDVLAARVRLNPARYATGPSQSQFFDNLLTALSARPDVQAATLTATLPLSGNLRIEAFDPHPIRADYPGSIMIVATSSVSPDYFTAFRIPIRRGRALSPEDRAGAPRVAVINKKLANDLWPNQDPIGKTMPLGGGPGNPGLVTVVGVIDDLRSSSLTSEVRPEMLMAASQDPQMPQMWVAVRSRTGRPLALAGAIRDAVRQADAEQPIGEIVTLEQLVGRQTAAQRFNTSLLTLFALLAVGLALVGIYGVTSYAVTQRTRELGIRMALGAQPGDVVRLLVSESLGRVAVGVALGLIAALAATRVLKSLLFQVAPTDVVTFVTTGLLLGGVALVATWVPARRATRVDPMIALRSE